MVRTIGHQNSNVYKNKKYLIQGQVRFRETSHKHDISGLSNSVYHIESMLI